MNTPCFIRAWIHRRIGDLVVAKLAEGCFTVTHNSRVLMVCQCCHEAERAALRLFGQLIDSQNRMHLRMTAQ